MPIYKIDDPKNGKKTKYKVRVNYSDASGAYRQTDRIAYGLDEAKALEKALSLKLREEPPGKRITLNDLFEEYKKTKKHELRESSYDKTVSVIEHHVIPLLGDKSLSKLSKPVLMDWKNEINNKTVKGKDGSTKNLSAKMKQNIYAEFRALLNFGVKMDYLPKNNLTSIGNFKGADAFEIKKEMQYYTADEFKKYIAAAREQAENASYLGVWDYYVFFNIAFYTGLRKGEIHALKWSDIDGKYLSVSRSITQKLKGADRETPPKNRSSIRTIQMPEPLIDVLNEHKERYKKVNGFTEDFRICGGTRSLRDTSIANFNESFAKSAGVKVIRIHDFRHSHASLLANEGINIQEIARRLGHSNIEITWNTYSHLYPREEERAVKILNKIV